MAVETGLLPPRYRGPQQIGRGGMGEIYRATDDVLGRAVAVKILATRYSEDDAVRRRFTREALAAARLSGEASIVTIFDVGEWNERPFLVMEYLSGGSLDDRLRAEGAQPPERAVRWLEQAARALDAAHAHGVVHRDVKPGNLLLDRNDNVHVADFGIASAAGMDSLTMTGTVLGTAGYLSPEQAQGSRATPASDRYALGIVAFELLTGERPFKSESLTAEAAAHVHADVPSVCDRSSTLPCELDPVFERTLAKDPAGRYPTCADFVADLRHALAEAAGQTRVLTPVPPDEASLRPVSVPLAGPRPPYRRRRVWPIVVALLAATGGAGALAAGLFTGGDGTPEVTARERVVTKVVRAQGTTVRVQETVTTTVPVTQAPSSSSPSTVTVAAPLPGTPSTSESPTTESTATTQTTPSTSPPATGNVSTGEAVSLTDQSTADIRRGDYATALPLARQALAGLEGTGNIYEAYANYNVGKSLIGLGRCSEGLPYLDRSEAIQGSRKEIDRDRAGCGVTRGDGQAKGND